VAVCGELFASTVLRKWDGTHLDEAETPACEGRNPLPSGRGGCQLWPFVNKVYHTCVKQDYPADTFFKITDDLSILALLLYLVPVFPKQLVHFLLSEKTVHL
jgi:hypothetical protein